MALKVEAKNEELVPLVLSAHERYGYRGVTYEKGTVYSVESEFAAELLRHRTDGGSPVFGSPREKVEVKPDAPLPVVIRKKKAASVTIGGLSEEQTANAFNVKSDTAIKVEDPDFEKELAARTQAEAAEEAKNTPEGDAPASGAVEI